MKVRFDQKGNVLLQISDFEEIQFDTVSACLLYCRQHGLDPIVEDCEF